MRNGEPGMFIGISTMRNGHVQLQWSRIQAFLAFNSLALPVIYSVSQTQLQPNQLVSVQQQFLISFVGLILHVGLFLAGWRTVDWLKYWDEKLAALEQLDQGESDMEGARVQVFSSVDFKERRGSWYITHAYLWPIGAGTLFWFYKTIQHSLAYWH